MRRLGAAVLLLLATGQGMAAPAAIPHRIMSLKICTDELLMDLAPPSRIASVTFLSRERAALKLWPQAAQIPVNHNSPEEVLATQPDLVLTDSFTSPQMRALLAQKRRAGGGSAAGGEFRPDPRRHPSGRRGRGRTGQGRSR